MSVPVSEQGHKSLNRATPSTYPGVWYFGWLIFFVLKNFDRQFRCCENVAVSVGQVCFRLHSWISRFCATFCLLPFEHHLCMHQNLYWAFVRCCYCIFSCVMTKWMMHCFCLFHFCIFQHDLTCVVQICLFVWLNDDLLFNIECAIALMSLFFELHLLFDSLIIVVILFMFVPSCFCRILAVLLPRLWCFFVFVASAFSAFLLAIGINSC